jgi:hypothetical protein
MKGEHCKKCVRDNPSCKCNSCKNCNTSGCACCTVKNKPCPITSCPDYEPDDEEDGTE